MCVRVNSLLICSFWLCFKYLMTHWVVSALKPSSVICDSLSRRSLICWCHKLTMNATVMSVDIASLCPCLFLCLTLGCHITTRLHAGRALLCMIDSCLCLLSHPFLLQKISANCKVSHSPMCMWWWWWWFDPFLSHFYLVVSAFSIQGFYLELGNILNMQKFCHTCQ